MNPTGTLLGVWALVTVWLGAEGRAQSVFVTGPAVIDPLGRGLGASADKRESNSSLPPEPSGNPLWAVPLSSLSATREHPLFSASRRPPPPVIVGPTRPAPLPVVRRPEPERPPLTLVGTITSDRDGIAVFVENSSKAT